MKTPRSAIWVALGASLAFHALAQGAPTPAQQQLREIYKELVEINTTDSAGSCTAAAEAMAARLKAGGLPAQDVQVIVPPGGPKKGNLVARYRGTGAKRPVMLLGHLDVVEAKREDWQRDPFGLVEENGDFYARGAADDKLVPTLLAGATDGRFTINAGIPTYGVNGMFRDPDGGGVHGLNERIRVRSLYEGHEFLYRLVKLYASGR